MPLAVPSMRSPTLWQSLALAFFGFRVKQVPASKVQSGRLTKYFVWILIQRSKTDQFMGPPQGNLRYNLELVLMKNSTQVPEMGIISSCSSMRIAQFMVSINSPVNNGTHSFCIGTAMEAVTRGNRR